MPPDGAPPGAPPRAPPRAPPGAPLAAPKAPRARGSATRAAKPKAPRADVRRGPGRPPSRPPAPPLEKKGRVGAPQLADSRLEVVFGDPLCLKTLFTYFKNLKAREVFVRCAADGLHFLARDASRKSRIIGSALAEHSHWFYCEEQFDLHLNRESTEKIFATIDKSHYKLTLHQPHDDRDNLHLILHSATSGSQKHFLIPLSNFTPDEELMEAPGLAVLDEKRLAEQYPLEFTLDSKAFKKIVTDALHFSAELTIDATPDRPLRFSSASSSIVVTEAFPDPEKIGLRFDPKGGPILIPVKVANLKPLASSMVADTIRVLCRPQSDLLFTSELADRALVVQALTSVD